MHLTYNKNIKMIKDEIHHLDMEKDHLEANKPRTHKYMVSSNSQGAR